ncbi:MAG: glycosyltransferase, partial [Ilumatobacteraceae bacterium]
MIAVSVVIGTSGDRPRVRDAVASVLACTGVDMEVILVDHGLPSAAHWLGDLRDDRRLRHLSSSTMGVSAARNVGIKAARNEYVLIIDDDVTVDPGWAADFASELAATPDVAVAFCDVVAGTHDLTMGFVPDHVVRTSRTVRSPLAKSRIRGIGAGMAVRRDAVLAVGGFDEMLGPGAPLRSSEDRDLAMRTLLQGHAVRSTCATSVTHHGFRTWVEGRSLTERDWFGIGATYSKQIKTRDVRIIPVLVVEVVYHGLVRPLARMLRGHPPNGLRQIVYFVQGFRAGIAIPLDSQTGLFRRSVKAVVETAADTVGQYGEVARSVAPTTVVLRRNGDP